MGKSFVTDGCWKLILLSLLLTAVASSQTRLADRLNSTAAPDVSKAMKGSLPGTAPSHSASSRTSASASIASATSAKPHVLNFRRGRGGFRPSGPATSLASPPSPNTYGLPVWNSSFVTQGLEYQFSMVGTNPIKGQTSTIPAVIIPYRLVFSETGDVVDASADLVDGITPVNGVKNSPIFQSVPWSLGPTNVGNTQYGDAMMRANFWRIHSDQGKGYHVLLSSPIVLPTQTLIVDAQYGFVFIAPSGNKIAFVDSVWLDAQMVGIMQNPSNSINPSNLAIHLLPPAVLVDFGGTFLGYHSAFPYLGTNVLQTYIVTPYFSESDASFSDSEILGHEVAEWLNDPGASTQAPLWQDPNYGRYCWNPFLEVADPLYTFPDYKIPSKGRTYNLPEVAFLPWFAQSPISISVNGWYTSANLVGRTKPCPDFPLDQYPVYIGNFSYLYLDFPGANTYFYAINNRSQVVGATDNGGSLQSFLAKADVAGGTVQIVSSINVPGSSATFAYGINDAGLIVGTYYDQNQVHHGFLLQKGKYTTLDVPGAESTEMIAINNPDRPDELAFAGGYIDQAGYQHGFVFRGGHFTTVDAPFATNLLVTGINRNGEVVGLYASDSAPSVVLGFVGELNRLKPVTYPTNPDGFFFQGLNDKAQGVGFVSYGDAFQEIRNIYSPMNFGDFTAFAGINNAGLIAGSVYYQGTFDGLVFLPTSK